MWFRSKYRDLCESLSSEVAELRGELTTEMHRRVVAETLAEDRAQQLERSYELLAEANEERKEANRERLKSLDLVNTSLLAQHGPEKPGPDPKTFTPMYLNGSSHRKSAAQAQREADAALLKFMEEKRAKAKQPQAEEPPPAASVQ